MSQAVALFICCCLLKAAIFGLSLDFKLHNMKSQIAAIRSFAPTEQMLLLPAARLAVLCLHVCCFSWGFLALLCCLSSDLLELGHLGAATEQLALCSAGAEAPLQITALALAA